MKKLRLFTLALSVIYLVLAPTLINKNKETKKWDFLGTQSKT